MKSWPEISEILGAIFAIIIALIMIVSPVIIIVWVVWSRHYVVAVVITIAYLIMVFSFLMRPRHMDRMEMPRDILLEEARPERYPHSPVDFSVFAPRRIAMEESFVINLWVHLREQMADVMELAQLLQPSEAVGLRAGVPIEVGTEIVLRLQLPTLDVHEELDKITWTGQPSNASFRVWVPPDTTKTTHSGHFDIYTGGIRIARVLFDITLSSEESSTLQRRLRSRLERLRTAFASYSSADRLDVLGRIQGMNKIVPDLDIFLDALSLRSGELWESRLAEEIISKDVFYLFWSRNAAESIWVKKEWQHALANRGIDYIDPVPLETPEVAPPPDELGTLHFGDAFATFAFLQRGVDRKKADS